MSRERILLLMPVTTYRAADFVEAGIALGADVVVGCDRRQTLEEAVPGASLTLPLDDPEAALRQILDFAQKRPLRCVVGVGDETVELAAQASQALGLPHNPVESVRATRDKHRAREILRKKGIRVPRFRKFAAREDPSRVAQGIDFPCVLKPLFLSASRGVMRADDPAGLARAWERIGKILEEGEVRRKGGEGADWILVEDYIPGFEVAVEGLLIDGELKTLALFDKPDPLIGPTFEETLYVTPSRHPSSTQEAILRCAAQSAAALGLRVGPLHAEMRVNEEGVWIVELAARSIGGLCSRVLRFGAGISLEEVILRQALGLPVEALERERRAAGVMMIPIPRGGTLIGFGGIEAARLVPGVEGVVQSIPTGQDLVPLPEGSRYLGFIFARGENPEGVEASLREAHARLDIAIG
jgi:biotin carboxylase